MAGLDPTTAPTVARRGDLLLVPSTMSSTASASAQREGIAQSGRVTTWSFGRVTSITREGVAKAYEYCWYGNLRVGSGPVVGQLVASAASIAPLDVAAFVKADPGDYPTVDAARAAVRAAVDAAKAAAAAQPARYMAPDGRLYACGTGPAAEG